MSQRPRGRLPEWNGTASRSGRSWRNLRGEYHSFSDGCLPTRMERRVLLLAEPIAILAVSFCRPFTGLSAMAHLFAGPLHIPEAARQHARGFASGRENPPG